MKSSSRIRIIGKVEIKSRNVVKPIFFEGLKKIGNPDEIIQKYFKNGIDEILIVDVVSSLYKRDIDFEFLKLIGRNLFIPLIYSGGIKNLTDIENCLQNGADKVAINTNGIKNPKLLKNSVKKFGSQCISVTIEAKKINNNWLCFTDGGRINSKIRVTEWIKKVQDLGVGEIIIQSVDCDGHTAGPDYNLFKKVSKSIHVPLVLCSGIRNISHIKFIKKKFNPEAIALSSALHYNEIKINNVKKVL
tara:strand:+ start:3243 stop:3980 length:738 start_codon:yes stop_codon:yes gene_type:complete